MPWRYVWNVKTQEKEHEVELVLGILGRERVIVDGQVTADAYSWKIARRIPVPLEAGHTAGLEVSMRTLWPRCSLSVDGVTVQPQRKPRVPLWSFALALVCLGSFAVPLKTTNVWLGSLRGAVTGLSLGLCIYTGAAARSQLGAFLASAFFAAASWAGAFLLK